VISGVRTTRPQHVASAEPHPATDQLRGAIIRSWKGVRLRRRPGLRGRPERFGGRLALNAGIVHGGLLRVGQAVELQ